MRMLTGHSRRFQRNLDYHFGRRRAASSVVRERVALARPSRHEARKDHRTSEN